MRKIIREDADVYGNFYQIKLTLPHFNFQFNNMHKINNTFVKLFTLHLHLHKLKIHLYLYKYIYFVIVINSQIYDTNTRTHTL